MRHFDVVVVGTGVAGQTAASELARAGKRVAVTDVREFGGTCALRGCEPKKTLFTAAEVSERFAKQAGHGPAGEVRVDWPSLMAFKRTFTAPVPERIEEWLAGEGAEVLHGNARFVSPDVLDVAGEQVSAEHFVIAVGARPLELGIPGAELVIDSEKFMELESLPERIAFIGGGYISFEFAHIAAAAGSRCTILHRSARALTGFEPELVDLLIEGYGAGGIEVHTDAPVIAVEQAGGPLRVICANGTDVECDAVVHGAGRVPALAGLDPEAGGVAVSGRGVSVDDSMRSTSNPRVFAVGDAAALGAPLTPVAIVQARVALANILDAGSARFEPGATPSVVFSDPVLASVGLTEAQAREDGLDVDVKLSDMSGWASSRRLGQHVAAAKTVVERSTGRILGAHLLGHGADEAVNVVAVAMLGGLTAHELRGAVLAYPTAGSDLTYVL